MIVESRFARALPVLLLPPACDGNEGRVAAPGLPADSACNIESGQTGHAEVEKSHIRPDACGQIESRSSIVGGFDLAGRELDVHLLDQKQRHMTLALGDGGRITVRASPDFSHWVVWTVPGKDYVCVEPWTAPGNALNTGERLLTLAAGRRHESFMEIEFAT